MENTKTIREWLKELPEQYRDKALKNAEMASPCKLDVVEGSLDDAILGGFTWEATPEGFNFWDKLHEELFNKEQCK